MKLLFSGRVNLLHQKQDNIVKSIESLYSKMGVDFVFIDDETKCGEASLNLGLTEDAARVVNKFKKQVEEIKPDVIVSPYAAGVAKYRNEIPEKYGVKLGVPYIHITQFFAENKKKFSSNIGKFPHKYFIHHGCTMGRKIGEYQYVREVLNEIAGIDLCEEDHPSAELEGRDIAEFNTCPGSWLNMSQPELSDFIKENYILEIIKPVNPEYVGSSCANGQYGISQGLNIAEVKDIKPLYFTELLDNIWRG